MYRVEERTDVHPSNHDGIRVKWSNVARASLIGGLAPAVIKQFFSE
jgi:hypothetical protein